MQRKGHSLAWKSGLHSIVIVYCSLDRSVLEYAAVAFTNPANYLANDMEKNPEARPLHYHPFTSYEVIQRRTGRDRALIRQRREDTCVNFVKESVLKTQSSL